MFSRPQQQIIRGGLTIAEGETNAGGITRLWLVPAHQVRMKGSDFIPRSEISGFEDLKIDRRSFRLLGGASFVEIEVIPEYTSFSEKVVPAASGEAYQVSLGITIPKDRQTVTAWLHRYRAFGFVALFTDRNGQHRLAGTDRQPLYIDAGGSIGKSRNSKSVSLQGTTPTPAYYVADPAILTTKGDFSSDFSSDFK